MLTRMTRSDFSGEPLAQFCQGMQARLNDRTMRIVGKPALPVKRVAASWGAGDRFDPPSPLLARADVDVLVVGEAREWELVEYAQDSITAGNQKALIILGHVVSEQGGMKYCTEWLKSFMTDVSGRICSGGGTLLEPRQSCRKLNGDSLTSIITGIGWHMVGAASAASFYAPISKVKRWTWETTWAVAGLFSWILLPICVSAILLPDVRAFYTSLDSSVVLKTLLFGAMWGSRQRELRSLTMRYLGMSLGIGVAIGVTLVVGTLIPPLVHGQAIELVTTRGGLFTLLGILVALCGIVIVSIAGHRKELALGSEIREFNVKKGLLLAVMCGIFSSGMSFAIDAARPMQASALAAGVKPLYSALPSYVIIMGGGALVNFAYCFSRLIFKKEFSLKADLALPGSILFRNGALAATGRHHVVSAVLFSMPGGQRVSRPALPT